MARRSNYDKHPFVPVGPARECAVGWDAIAGAIIPGQLIVVECYPGVDVEAVQNELVARLHPATIVSASDSYKSPVELQQMFQPLLTDDPVFGRMNGMTLDDYFDPALRSQAHSQITKAVARGRALVIGTGASLLAPKSDVLVYADMARWEIQLRFRRSVLGNLGLDNRDATFAVKYKTGYFIEWRAADRLKRQLLPRFDFLLDTNDPSSPKLISGESLRRGLALTARRPFRVVPYFDPGPWGGHWMEEVCDLPRDTPNHAWCFDCVPEENSLLLGFGNKRVEIPAIDLVFSHPRELLGDAVHGRFGAEFPIRFDFLDTMGGGNLSLQVHPLTEYIQDKFGMHFTQDESYYLLDAGEDATVYLGLKDDIDPSQMLHDLRSAQQGGPAFPAEKYVNRWPAKKHDHFLIPAGTVHCSGKDSMVLEISATPYIFTFKLWDWGRLGLDGRPRPIHIDHGAANIQWDRTTEWTCNQLIDQIRPLSGSNDWREEATGLHPREFIETRRHWFTGTVPHNTHGGVQVLNLVQGEEAIVESPTAAFAPFVVHYAETFIVPAAVGAYTIRPSGIAIGTECATILAFVRTGGCT
jgi:mannose-6-phosphate isomerase class I